MNPKKAQGSRMVISVLPLLVACAAIVACGEEQATGVDGSDEAETDAMITFRVQVPQSTPEDAEIWVSGGHPSMGRWDGYGLPAGKQSDGSYAASMAFPVGILLEFKVTRGGWETVEKSATGAEIPNRRHTVSRPETLDLVVGAWRDQIEEPPEHSLTGEIRYHRDVSSEFLRHDRDVIVYLPSQYKQSPEHRYPVLYMHDGQNIFDTATSFLGIEWSVDESARRLIEGGEIDPLIVVGVYNSPERVAEYTPVADPSHGGGDAANYARFLIEELKSMIDSTYRTRPDAKNTGTAGSSLGGIVSLYLGLEHPDVFTRIGVVSPAAYWADEDIVQRARTSEKLDLHIWLDVGTAEGSTQQDQLRFLESTRRLRDALIATGWVLGEDLSYFEDVGAAHNEAAWARRVPEILRFLFPKE
jgi:predicted alpha/beta superfamily hydrolase